MIYQDKKKTPVFSKILVHIILAHNYRKAPHPIFHKLPKSMTCLTQKLNNKTGS